MSDSAAFNFPRDDELSVPRPPRSLRPVFRRLGACGDRELLNYLSSRRISPGFLIEVDMLLRNYPELEHHAPRFVEEFNRTSPLNAYLHFLKGFTRPCRYLPGVIPEVDFTLDENCHITRIVDKRDQELEDFFRDYEYRFDILETIDREVLYFCSILKDGGRISRNQRMLVAYHLWGQPVDCYKWYEYNYQTEWLAHRYLPEHVVLSNIPKDPGYVEPHPYVLAGPGRSRNDVVRRYKDIRKQMAMACDQGVDVIDVLLEGFTRGLARKGLTRQQISDARKAAIQALDEERVNGTGKDIVDLVMDSAKAVPLQAPGHEKTLLLAALANQTVLPNFSFITPNMTAEAHMDQYQTKFTTRCRSTKKLKQSRVPAPNISKSIKKPPKKRRRCHATLQRTERCLSSRVGHGCSR
ncbi:hypothetical protein EJ05DRAFT_515015 [Pseudovirgaria hyperparasitica]|uniref:Uncharacterized protein n=1 Tax=Pseudovirgaria hyperparasitica TaxID=470096 RepID=A0A6A6VSB4_9PEZI|nr:uncharacterized protein EJ05DRAFT_515015 [Pseudovirgaria hyperparasitica]KAF2753558.1 hypothetical protein EJ05DRAFT_515015 [Pseudovirgaria hyperparasitica]